MSLTAPPVDIDNDEEVLDDMEILLTTRLHQWMRDPDDERTEFEVIHQTLTDPAHRTLTAAWVALIHPTGCGVCHTT